MIKDQKNQTVESGSTDCYLSHRVFIKPLEGVNSDKWVPFGEFESMEDAKFAVECEKEMDAKVPVQRYRYKIERIDGSKLLLPEFEGDIRDPMAGCWHVIDSMNNSTVFGPRHCRKPCVVGARYCNEHQKR